MRFGKPLQANRTKREIVQKGQFSRLHQASSPSAELQKLKQEIDSLSPRTNAGVLKIEDGDSVESLPSALSELEELKNLGDEMLEMLQSLDVDGLPSAAEVLENPEFLRSPVIQQLQSTRAALETPVEHFSPKEEQHIKIPKFKPVPVVPKVALKVTKASLAKVREKSVGATSSRSSYSKPKPPSPSMRHSMRSSPLLRPSSVSSPPPPRPESLKRIPSFDIRELEAVCYDAVKKTKKATKSSIDWSTYHPHKGGRLPGVQEIDPAPLETEEQWLKTLRYSQETEEEEWRLFEANNIKNDNRKSPRSLAAASSSSSSRSSRFSPRMEGKRPVSARFHSSTSSSTPPPPIHPRPSNISQGNRKSRSKPSTPNSATPRMSSQSMSLKRSPLLASGNDSFSSLSSPLSPLSSSSSSSSVKTTPRHSLSSTTRHTTTTTTTATARRIESSPSLIAGKNKNNKRRSPSTLSQKKLSKKSLSKSSAVSSLSSSPSSNKYKNTNANVGNCNSPLTEVELESLKVDVEYESLERKLSSASMSSQATVPSTTKHKNKNKRKPQSGNKKGIKRIARPPSTPPPPSSIPTPAQASAQFPAQVLNLTQLSSKELSSAEKEAAAVDDALSSIASPLVNNATVTTSFSKVPHPPTSPPAGNIEKANTPNTPAGSPSRRLNAPNLKRPVGASTPQRNKRKNVNSPKKKKSLMRVSTSLCLSDCEDDSDTEYLSAEFRERGREPKVLNLFKPQKGDSDVIQEFENEKRESLAKKKSGVLSSAHSSSSIILPSGIQEPDPASQIMSFASSSVSTSIEHDAHVVDNVDSGRKRDGSTKPPPKNIKEIEKSSYLSFIFQPQN